MKLRYVFSLAVICILVSGTTNSSLFAQVSFAPAVDYVAGYIPMSVAIGDLNGDGKLDLAVANEGSGNVSVLLGNGDGTFQTAKNFNTGTYPRSVAIGDLNGDGFLDLAVANSSSGNVSVLLGDGTGSFGAATNFSAGVGPYSVAIADLNGDGSLDLAVANFSSLGPISVLLGNGDGTFLPAQNVSAGTRPISVATGYLNADGFLDLAVADYDYNGTVSVRLGNGDGTFLSAPDVSVGSYPFSVAIGDLNGDGFLDLAVANFSSNHVSVLLGYGDGTFQAAKNFSVPGGQRSVAIGDLNCDGKLDLAMARTAQYTSQNVYVLLGDGTGSFGTAMNFHCGKNSSSVAIDDLNKDGTLDLAVTNKMGGVSILLNKTVCPATQCVPPPSGMVGWWSGDNNTNDLSSNHNNGTLHGTAAYTSGKVSGAFDLSVGSPYVLAPSIDAQNFGTGDFSIDAWILNKDSTLFGTYSIIDKRTHDSSQLYVGYLFFLYEGHLSLQLADGIGNPSFSNYSVDPVDPNVSDGAWHFVSVTVDRDSLISFYIDGALVRTRSPLDRTGSLTNSGNVCIGSESFNPGSFFNGYLDEVELFNRVLTQDDISSIYNAGSAGKCKTPLPSTGSICGYKFNDANGNGILDSTETKIGNWIINYSGPVSGTIITDTTGNYCLTNLPTGTYTLCETLQVGWTPTTPTCQEVLVGAGQTVTVIFGNQPTPQGFCPGNILQNGDFTTGLMPGAMPSPGQVSNWISAYRTPDVAIDSGCGDIGFINMWGNKIVGEAIQQQLPSGGHIKKDHLYRIQLCYKWAPPNNNRPYPVSIKVRASVGPLLGPVGGIEMALTSPTYSTAWITSPQMTWVADNDYYYVTVSAENQSSVNHGDSTSTGQVDRICIEDLGTVPNGSICGTKFLDLDGDCERDTNETGLGGWLIKLDPLGYYATTDSGGYYCFSDVPQGNYTLSEVLKNGWIQTCPVSGSYSVTLLPGQYQTGFNFGNKLAAGVQDLTIQLAAGTARPGFEKQFAISYSNAGSVTVNSITVKFSLPADVNYVSSNPSGTYNSSTHSVTWNVGTLNPGNAGWITIVGQVKIVPLGTTLTSCATIEPAIEDVAPQNNTACETQVVRGSWDPNDKAVAPTGVGSSHIVSNNDVLTYQIRFQNTGTDTAFTIVIGDILDQNLDLSTLQTGASSHPYTYQIVNGRELWFTFSNILLPDSNVNEPGSHGFVWFQVAPKSSLPNGTNISNSASIYFDFNFPVLTNTVSNCIGTITTINVQQRWNMVSVPVLVSDFSKSALFPTAASNAFAYEGGYLMKDTLERGKGYWLKFDEPQTIQIDGIIEFPDCTMTVMKGWNMIGSTSRPIPRSDIILYPESLAVSKFFGYHNSYYVSDTIQPGSAYWVKANLDGIIALKESMETRTSHQAKILFTDELPPPPPDEGILAFPGKELPKKFTLGQNYPNPFNPTTVIQYELPVQSHVTLSVYNIMGQRVAVLVDQVQDAGYREATFDGSKFSSGVYFYRLQAGSFIDTKKLLLLK
ncbi:MAG: VCBS repeat-containing protein [Ignavibacteriales bacterium]|nr:VCBS repeat-containing protein [Ignavibacteriales bacterium]